MESWLYRTKKKTIVNGTLRTQTGTIDQVETNGINNVSGKELESLSGASANIQEQLNALSENLSDLGTKGGGLSYKRTLTAADDLDNIVEDGIYDWAANSYPSNRPSGCLDLNSMLVVETAKGVFTTVQTLYVFNGGIYDVYSRRHWLSGWSDWTKWAMETNASAQGMLNKTPVSGDPVTDADGIFGTHNGNFVTRSLSKLWEWIVSHLAKGILGDVYIRSTGVTERRYQIEVDTAGTKKAGRLCISNAKNFGIYDETLGKWVIVETPSGDTNINGLFGISPTGIVFLRSSGVPTMYLQRTGSGDSWGALQKYMDGSTDSGTHVVDRTNGVNTDLRVQYGGASINGSEILRQNNLFSLFPNIVTGDNYLNTLSGKVPVLWKHGGYDCWDEPKTSYIVMQDDIHGFRLLCIGIGCASTQTSNGNCDYCVVILVIGTYLASGSYDRWQKVVLGTNGSTARITFATRNPSDTSTGELRVAVPKGANADYWIYKL